MKGQSAVEYLMTYGWMLIVVAGAGGAIYSFYEGQIVESSTGFNNDVIVDDFGINGESELMLEISDPEGAGIEIQGINVTDSKGIYVYKNFTEDKEISNDGRVCLIDGFRQSRSSNSLDIKIIYNSGGLENLVTNGRIESNIAVNKSSEIQGGCRTESVQSANFELTGISADEASGTSSNSIASSSVSLAQGKKVNFSANILNSGEEQGTQSINLNISGNTIVDQKSITLDAGESGNLEYSPVALNLAPGSHSYSIETKNDTESGSLTLEEIPIFQTTILQTYQDSGTDEFTVEVSLENIGSECDTQTVKADVDGDWSWSQEEEKEINLCPSATTEVNLTGNLESGSVTAEAWTDRWEIDGRSEAYDDTSAEGPAFFFVTMLLSLLAVIHWRMKKND